MNFLFLQKRKYFGIPSRYLVKTSKHTFRPMLFGREPTLLIHFFFCSSSFLSVSTSRFLLCAGKRTSVSVSRPPRVTSLSWLWEKRQTDSHRGLCRLYHGSDSSEKKIYFRLLKIQPVQDQEKAKTAPALVSNNLAKSNLENYGSSATERERVAELLIKSLAAGLLLRSLWFLFEGSPPFRHASSQPGWVWKGRVSFEGCPYSC